MLNYSAYYHPPLLTLSQSKITRRKLIAEIEKATKTRFSLIYTFPESEKDIFSIEDARRVLELVVNFQAKDLGLIIIKELDKASLEGQNALLKVLEDSSSKFVFLLEANTLENLPSTILSRCQILRQENANSVKSSESFEVILQNFVLLETHQDLNSEKLKNELALIQQSIVLTLLSEEETKRSNFEKISSFSAEIDKCITQLEKLRLNVNLVYLHLRQMAKEMISG